VRDNGIGSQEIKVIANGLKRDKSLKQLNLECNNIGERGANHIADMLKVNT